MNLNTQLRKIVLYFDSWDFTLDWTIALKLQRTRKQILQTYKNFSSINISFNILWKHTDKISFNHCVALKLAYTSTPKKSFEKFRVDLCRAESVSFGQQWRCCVRLKMFFSSGLPKRFSVISKKDYMWGWEIP